MITFFSEVHGQTGVSTNAFCYAVYKAVYDKERVLLLSYTDIKNDFEGFIGNKVGNQDEDFLFDNGINGLFREEEIRGLSESAPLRYAVNLFSGLNIMSGNISDEIIDDKSIERVLRFLASCDKMYDTVIVDAGVCSRDSDKKNHLWTASSKMIHCLSQNEKLLERTEVTEKTVFLVGCYDKASVYNINNISKIINRSKKVPLVAVNYETKIRDSWSNKSLGTVLRKRITGEKNSDNKEFIASMKQLDRFVLCGIAGNCL